MDRKEKKLEIILEEFLREKQFRLISQSEFKRNLGNFAKSFRGLFFLYRFWGFCFVHNRQHPFGAWLNTQKKTNFQPWQQINMCFFQHINPRHQPYWPFKFLFRKYNNAEWFNHFLITPDFILELFVMRYCTNTPKGK